MLDFKKALLETKKVSVWGIGYLGYTATLRLQSKGFFVSLFDFKKDRLDGLRNGNYPTVSQKLSWTKKGEIPLLDFDKIEDTENKFDSCVHIISMPSKDDLNKLVELFLSNTEKLKNSLIIFQSVGIPGSIEKEIIKPLKNRDIFFASAFRSDWDLETFLSDNRTRVIAGFDKKSLQLAEKFFELFNIETTSLNTIKEAEIFENSRIALENTINAFTNQLVISYPQTDIRQLSQLLFKNIESEDLKISMGGSKYKIANANGNLMQGSKKDEGLSILKEADSANLSLILHYGDLIVKKGYKSVSIYGISEEEDLKETRVAPAIMLAEYLLSLGVKVLVNDPFFTNKEIKEFLPNVEIFELKEEVKTEVVFFMTAHKDYKYLTSKDLKNLKIDQVKLIIDNTETFKDFEFSKDTLYHIAGDGKLGELE